MIITNSAAHNTDTNKLLCQLQVYPEKIQ